MRYAHDKDIDYEFCKSCKKAVKGGLTVETEGDVHVCDRGMKSVAEIEEESLGSLHSRQRSSLPGLISLCLLLGNVGLCIYSHLGLSAEILTNIRPEVYAGSKATPCAAPAPSGDQCSVCDATDIDKYAEDGELAGLDAQQGRCGLGCGTLMLSGPTCAATCLKAAGYSPHCAQCIALNSMCILAKCFSPCIGGSNGAGCHPCSEANCAPEFRTSSGLPIPVYNASNPDWAQPVLGNSSGPPPIVLAPTDAENVGTSFYGVPVDGQISFVYSVHRAWTGGAEWLAIVIVIASGIWPYLKNVLMFFAWFTPMSNKNCTALLTTVTWLGRFSLVDVLAVLVLTIALNFQLANGKVHVICESRPAIVAFGIVAVWALMQGEWMLHLQRRGEALSKNYAGFETRKNGLGKKFLDRISTPTCCMLLAATCLACTIIAISVFAYTFQVNDVTAGGQGILFKLALGTILQDVRFVDFPTGICFVFVVLFPLLTSTTALFWAMTGQHPNFGLWVLQAARMCCMDVFFIACAVLGGEFGNLITAVVSGVSPCYNVNAVGTFGVGLLFCIIQAICLFLLQLAIDHKVEYTLSPELPYRQVKKEGDESLNCCEAIRAAFKSRPAGEVTISTSTATGGLRTSRLPTDSVAMHSTTTLGRETSDPDTTGLSVAKQASEPTEPAVLKPSEPDTISK